MTIEYEHNSKTKSEMICSSNSYPQQKISIDR